ncbi:hypothetical protein KEM55_007795 [Ascosphaera atra]|nr:hypothetical protein KEM55_007795 [Ascosphaera atra]
MRSMLLGIYDEALVRTVPASSLAGNSYPFAQLSLHTATVEDLTFIKEFQVELSEDIDALDGFVIWFDMFFMPSPTYKVPPENTALYMKKKEFFTAFTTGPEGPETHWQQTLCLVDRTKLPRKELKKGQVIKGKVSYSKKNKETRSLDIGIDWEAEAVEKSHQEWSIM